MRRGTRVTKEERRDKTLGVEKEKDEKGRVSE